MAQDQETEKPIWEYTYAQDTTLPIAAPSAEIVRLAEALPAGSRVLDVGCGDGRNALFLAERGFRIEGFDVSQAGIARLLSVASERGLDVRAWVGDMTTQLYDGEYDWILCHGVLHLIEREEWQALVPRLMAATRPGGVHVCAVFTDSLPPPGDLAPFWKGIFREGELADVYEDWDIESFQAYTFDDEHFGGVRHRHALNKIVAWKPRVLP